MFAVLITLLNKNKNMLFEKTERECRQISRQMRNVKLSV